MFASTFIVRQANALAAFALLLFVAFAASINNFDVLKKVVPVNSEGATISGGCEKDFSPHLVNTIDIDSRITYCSSGDADRHIIEISKYESSNEFTVYTVGYFSENVKLVFEVDGEIVLPIGNITTSPGETWTAQKISLPNKGNKKIKISLIDNGTSFKEWAGISIPTKNYHTYHIIDQIQVIFWLVLFFITSVSLTALSYRIVSNFTRSDAIATPTVFILLCSIYYLNFWIYYLSHDIGLIFSYLVISASIFLLFRSLFRYEFFTLYKSSNTLKIYLLPILYVIVLFSFSVSYGDLTSIQKTAAKTFTHELPIDNFLPKIFADQLYHEKISHPMVGDWLSSDRPPLQTGQFLFFYKLYSGNDIGYQLNAMLLQAYFLVPIILLLNLLFKGNRIIKLLIVTSIAFSSVALVNTVYVWPKLIAGTALLLITYILLISSLFKNKITPIILSTILAMISMLAHSGSIFSLIPIAIISFFVFKPSFKNIFAALAVALLMFGPWMIYQKHIDPPGDRLIKWHLAGQIEINQKSFTDTFRHAYKSTPSDDLLVAKISNFKKIFENVLSFDYISAPIKVLQIDHLNENSINHMKTKLFFNFFYSMGIIFIFGFSAAIFSIFIKRLDFFGLPLTLFFIAPIISLILWCLLMFEAGSTVIHQGSYFPWMALMFIFSIFISSVFKRFSIVIFSAHLIISFCIYFLSVSTYHNLLNPLLLPVYLTSIIAFISFAYKHIECSETHQPIRNLYVQ